MTLTTKQAFIAVIVIAVVGAVAAYFLVGKQERSGGVIYETSPSAAPGEPSGERPPVEGVACTLDAKLCPDGSSVGRTGPNCEFAPCPGEISSEPLPNGWVRHGN